MPLPGFLKRLRRGLAEIDRLAEAQEHQALLLGRLLAERVAEKGAVESLREVEFKVFSQFGDDGIIQWLARHLDLPSRTFAEFGVGDYRESNTRFLLMNDNWSGLVMDGSAQNVAAITGAEYYWRHGLTAKAAFIDRGNINGLLAGAGLGAEPGLLHIDLDGNDYWVWEAIEGIAPVIVIVEYNSHFGRERAISVPYDPAFDRGRAHHSNLFFGASVPAFNHLAAKKGYAFVGCNSAGNNAYYVRRDKLNGTVREAPLERGFVDAKFRESRGPAGRLTFLSGPDRLAALRGMPVVNVLTGAAETL